MYVVIFKIHKMFLSNEVSSVLHLPHRMEAGITNLVPLDCC